MPPIKRAKGPKKQGTRCRQSYTLEQKQFAINLRKSGKANREIIKALKDKFGLTVKSSSVATMYNAKNMKKIEAHGVTALTGQEKRVNPIQRPRILVDMEHFLGVYIERQNETGVSVTKSFLSHMPRVYIQN